VQLVSYEGGFGRVEDASVVPLGHDLAAWLADGEAGAGEPLPLASLALLAPVPRPGKIVCVGRNYVEHAHERGFDAPPEPILFAKWANSVSAPGATVVVPEVTAKPDWEAELGVVIGATCARVPGAGAVEQRTG
jgi:2-keto-4-pentenoate hydratase/2-oxohepta-3-ene-1,7-dioic acid hydratase in catechol pathway